VNLLDSRIKIDSNISNYYPLDAIIHCAHDGSDEDSGMESKHPMFNNLMMIYKLLEISGGKKVFYFGSGSEFDKKNDLNSVTEEEIGKNVPRDNMGMVKYVMNMVAAESSNLYNLRLFGVFGENNIKVLHRRIIYDLCIKAANHMDLVIKDNHKYDFLYVQDLASIVSRFLNKSDLKYHDYNVCSGTAIEFVEIAKLVKNASGNKHLNIKVENEKGRNYCGDNARMTAEIGSVNFTPIEQSIESVYKWIYDNKLYGLNKYQSKTL
jgi:UDP-glucose 4-epimerase